MFVIVTAVFQDMRTSVLLVSLLVTIKNELFYYNFCNLLSKKEHELPWVGSFFPLTLMCLNCLTKELQALQCTEFTCWTIILDLHMQASS